MKRTFIYTLCVLLTVLSLVSCESNRTGQIYGTVYTYENRVVVGYPVELHKDGWGTTSLFMSTTTSGGGFYSFDNVPYGTYVLKHYSGQEVITLQSESQELNIFTTSNDIVPYE